jgi:hypothetical protein
VRNRLWSALPDATCADDDEPLPETAAVFCRPSLVK